MYSPKQFQVDHLSSDSLITEALLNIEYVSIEKEGFELSHCSLRRDYCSWLDAICHVLKDAGIIGRIEHSPKGTWIYKE